MRHSPTLGLLFLCFGITCLSLVLGLNQLHLVHAPPQLDKPDFAKIEDIATRKQAFFEFLIPLIEYQNQNILTIRQRLLKIEAEYNKSGLFSRRSRHYLQQLAGTYRLDDAELTTEQQLARLRRRVDIIPLPLALAHAASESGGGQSRFAQTAYNFFGQWCYVEGCGIVPQRRASGARHEVAKFASVADAVRSYFLNINTHTAYREFRARRQEIRTAGKRPRSEDLISTLLQYSERREAYLHELQQIIRANNLNYFEQAE